jgi:ABC-type sugar transport system ATPase subunit
VTLPAAVEAPAVLRMRGIDKSFLGVRVLHDITLDVQPGEVHAIVGENGAGKSTLMKILAGVHQADAGGIELAGTEVAFAHPLEAQQAGVSTVFQEFNLLPERSIAENVFVGRESRTRGLVDGGRMAADTAALLHELGFGRLSPYRRVKSLSVAEQQVVEIVKALSHDARVISLDEPTAALADQEVDLLYGLIRRLKERGTAILYVSHRLKEIFDICDRVTVLKDGAHVVTADTADITQDELVRAMVGRSFTSFFPGKVEGTTTTDVRLRVVDGGNDQLDAINLDLRGGEIVGLAGLQGSGRTELCHALFGVDRFTRGEVLLDGHAVDLRSPRHAVEAGLALVTEDRKAEGLALQQSVGANARMVLDAVFSRGASARARRIPGILSSLDLVYRGTDQEVRFLSGGNQQKVVLAKWLATEPAVMVLDEPTRGIDVGAKQRVYALMRELAAAGIAILMTSSELPELIGMADRIVVLHDGRVGGELLAGADEETVMALATGHASNGGPSSSEPLASERDEAGES